MTDIASLEALPHAARIKAVIDLGRRAANDAQAQQALAQLAADPGFFAQMLVIYAKGYGARDVASLKLVLQQASSRTLRQLAKSILLDICDDHAIPDVLLNLCGMAQASHHGPLLSALHRLRKNGRSNAAAQVVHAVVLLTAPDIPADKLTLLQQVLPFGSDQQVTVLLSALESAVGAQNLSSNVDLSLLVQWHPRVATEFVVRQKASLRSTLYQQMFKAFMRNTPESALELFNSLPADTRASLQIQVQALAKKFPGRILDQLLTMVAIPEEDHSLHGYLIKAQAQRKALLAQRAAAKAAATGVDGSGAPGGPPAAGGAPATSGDQHMESAGDGTLGSEDSAGDDGSWVLPSSVGDPASLGSASQLGDDAGDAMAVDGDTAAPVKVDVTAPPPPQPVYGLVARKPLYKWLLEYNTTMLHGRKAVRDSQVSNGLLLQMCLAGLRPGHVVLYRLPVERRRQLYQAWRSWWDQEVAKLKAVESSVPSQSAPLNTSRLQKMREILEGQALNVWSGDLPKVTKLLPVDCLLDLVDFCMTQLETKKSSTVAQVTRVLLASNRLPAQSLLALVDKYPDLQHGPKTPALASVWQQFSGPQQAQLLSSSQRIKRTEDTLRMALPVLGKEGASVLLAEALGPCWEAAVRVYLHRQQLGQVDELPVEVQDALNTKLAVDNIRSLQTSLPVLALRRLLDILTAGAGSEEVLVKLLMSTGAVPGTAADNFFNAADAAEGWMMQECLWPEALTDVQQRWEQSRVAQAEFLSSVVCPAIAQLAQGASAPLRAVFENLELCLRLLMDTVAYTSWLKKGKGKGSSVLVAALTPETRLAFLSRAAADTAALFGPDWHQAPLMGRLNVNPSSFSMRAVLLLSDRPTSKSMLQDMTPDQFKVINTLVPGLWTRVPAILLGLPEADRLTLLTQWKTTRSKIESSVALLLASTTTTDTVAAAAAATSGDVAPMAVDEGSGESGGAANAVGEGSVSLPPVSTEQVAALCKELLSSGGDPVVGAVKDHTSLSAKEQYLVYDLLRDVLLEEWVSVPLELLPLSVRPLIARARILRVSEKNKDTSPSALFSQIQSDLRYLTWREIMDHPGVKDQLQSRDTSTRSVALQYLIETAVINPDIWPQLLNNIHVRRREQDETRLQVLTALNSVVPKMARLKSEGNVIEVAKAKAEAIAVALLPKGHEEAPELRAKAVEAAVRAAGAPSSLFVVSPKVFEDIRREQAVLNNLPGLALVFKDSLSARDLSKDSLKNLLTLALFFLPVAMDWSASQLGLLLTQSGLSMGTDFVREFISTVKQLLVTLRDRFENMKSAVTSALEAACAGKRGEWKFLGVEEKEEEEPSVLPPAGPHRGRSRRSRANMARAIKERERKPIDKFKGGCNDLLQECYLLEITTKVLPVLMSALSKRQDGLYCVLRLAKGWSDLVFQLGPRLMEEVDTWASVQPALTTLLLSLLEPVAALKSASALDPLAEAQSVSTVAWYVDQVMLRAPEHYHKVKHLMMTQDRALASLIKNNVMNSIHNSLPVGRLDVLLPFMLEQSSIPEAAAKAVSLLFRYHPEQVKQVVPQLLAKDATFFMLPPVFKYVAHHRQELLPSLVLTQDGTLRPVTGMFATTGGVFNEFLNKRAGTGVRVYGGGRRGGGRGGATRGGRGGGGGCGTRRQRGSGRVRAPYQGWSRGDGLSTSLWLGLPTLGLTTTSKFSATQQEAIGKALVSTLGQGTLNLNIVRGIVRRVASLPALPASYLLKLLESASAATQGGEGAKSENGQEAVQDVVLAALVKLDDGSQAWSALLDALTKGESATALSAISALLSAEIRSLGGSSTTAAEAATGLGSTVSNPVDERAAELIGKMRQLPWQRPSVLREVIKLLGLLATRSPLAVQELILIAAVASTVKQAPKEAPSSKDLAKSSTKKTRSSSSTAPTAAGAAPMDVAMTAPASVPTVDTSMLPLPAGKELHRSSHLQLLTTLQDYYHLPEVQSMFLISALAEDKEIAWATAYVPSKSVQKAHPEVIPFCVQLFTTLLTHPDKEVRVKVMKTWAKASHTLSLSDGLPILNLLMNVKSKSKTERRTAKDSAAKWCARVIQGGKESKRRGMRGFAKMAAYGRMGKGGGSDDSDSDSGSDDGDFADGDDDSSGSGSESEAFEEEYSDESEAKRACREADQ